MADWQLGTLCSSTSGAEEEDEEGLPCRMFSVRMICLSCQLFSVRMIYIVSTDIGAVTPANDVCLLVSNYYYYLRCVL